MLNTLLLDAPPVLLQLGAGLVPAYPVRRRDWPLLQAGTAVAWLDTGEGTDYGARIVWAGSLLTNLLTPRGRGRFDFAPFHPAPRDEARFWVDADSVKRLYLLTSIPAPKNKAPHSRG